MGNVGFVFTSGDLKEVRDKVISNRVAAPARAGAYAPVDIYVPAGNTGMEPGKTSFFQALGVPTKIALGTIEIVSDVRVVESGNRVGQSESALLNLLNISPFTYGMTVVQIFDNGQVFSSDVLDVSEEELVGRFTQGIQQVASVSLAPEYEFEGSAKLKEMPANPEAFAAAAAPAAPAEEAKEEAKEEEEEDEDMGFGLFE